MLVKPSNNIEYNRYNSTLSSSHFVLFLSDLIYQITVNISNFWLIVYSNILLTAYNCLLTVFLSFYWRDIIFKILSKDLGYIKCFYKRTVFFKV